MALQTMTGYSDGPSGSPFPWIPVSELDLAVAAGYITKAEARTVVWSQLPALRVQAATTPPSIT